MVDTLVLGASAERRGGSSPLIRTKVCLILKHHIIYIPGLGDHRLQGQSLAVWLWRLYGVQSEVFRVGWRDTKSFGYRLRELLARIDTYVARGDSVSLVAASAGASAAVNAFAARRGSIQAVVLIAGKIRRPETLHPSVLRNNPAFEQSMERLPAALKLLSPKDRLRILNLHPRSDESVPVSDTKIEGVRERTLPVAGHVPGIAYAITIAAPRFIRELRRCA